MSMGHNSVDGKRMASLVERIEKLEAEKADLAEDIKTIYDEASGAGFNKKVLRKLIALRREDAEDRKEREELLDIYMSALGMS